MVHCAGAIKARSRNEFIDINAGGTRRLAVARRRLSNPPRLIHLSSLAAREPGLSSYAASKRAAEQVLRAVHRDLAAGDPASAGGLRPGRHGDLADFQTGGAGPVLRAHGSSGPDLPGPCGRCRPGSPGGAGDRPGPPPASTTPVEFDDGRPGGYTWAEIAAAAGAAAGGAAPYRAPAGSVLYMAGALGSLAARLTGQPNLIGWGKMREFLHPDWAARGPAPGGYAPQWTLEKGFADAVKWYASRGLLKSNP